PEEAEALLPYATDKAAEYIRAFVEHGSHARAAQSLGLNKSTLQGAVARVQLRAARQGYAPKHDLTHTVAPGQVLTGVSSMYGPDGELRAQWVKSSADQVQIEERIREAIEAL